MTADADPGKFSVNRIQINEDNIDDPDYVGPLDNKDAFTLDEVITMTGSVDTDGSEELFVRISNITEGAVLYFLGTTDCGAYSQWYRLPRNRVFRFG